MADLYHYTAAPFEFDRAYHYNAEHTRAALKPFGLWWGVGESWAEWCKREGFREYALAVKYRVHFKEWAKILRLKTEDELYAFDRDYRKPVNGMPRTFAAPDWERLRTETGWDGIEIAPYRWESRLDLTWYYGWDCASGVVWNLDAIDRLELIRDETTPNLVALIDAQTDKLRKERGS